MTTNILDGLELLSEIACGSAAGVLLSLAVYGWADWLYETLRRGDLVGASRECPGRAGPAAPQGATPGPARADSNACGGGDVGTPPPLRTAAVPRQANRGGDAFINHTEGGQQ